jgi:hypothetical protein
MKKLKKYMIIQCPHNSSRAVWEFIDDADEAMKYWYVKEAILKYGVKNVMPIVMNKLGGYHTHRPDADDVVDIIESYDWPNLKVWEQYPKNKENFKTGWISPTGDTYSCNMFDHVNCAVKLAEQLYGAHAKTVADDLLLKLGWFKATNKKYIGCESKMSCEQAKLFLEKGFTSHLDYEELMR